MINKLNKLSLFLLLNVFYAQKNFAACCLDFLENHPATYPSAVVLSTVCTGGNASMLAFGIIQASPGMIVAGGMGTALCAFGCCCLLIPHDEDERPTAPYIERRLRVPAQIQMAILPQQQERIQIGTLTPRQPILHLYGECPSRSAKPTTTALNLPSQIILN